MDKIQVQIDEQTKIISNHPFINWLKTAQLTPEEKLKSWVPCIIYFAFGFKDLNQFILKYPDEEAENDKLKAMINEHCKEDSGHWPWLIQDLNTLGLNRSVDLATAVKFLFGSKTQGQRLGHYDLIKLSEKAKDPLYRYCLMYAFERSAHIIFSAGTALGHKYEMETGNKLHYLGQTHLDHEEGHLQCSPTEMGYQEEIWKTEISDSSFHEISDIVKEVFQINTRRWNNFLEYVTKHFHHFSKLNQN